MMMKIGDVVKHRVRDVYGVVQYSTFGFSIHILDEEQDPPVLKKTLGMSVDEVSEHWEVVNCPAGFVATNRGLRKII